MPASVSMADLGEAPALRKGALGTTLSLQSTGQSNVILRGAGHADARAFADSVKAAWVSFNTGAKLNPMPPGTSKQANVRYLDIHEGDVLDEAQFKDWVGQASRLPGEKL